MNQQVWRPWLCDFACEILQEVDGSSVENLGVLRKCSRHAGLPDEQVIAEILNEQALLNSACVSITSQSEMSAGEVTSAASAADGILTVVLPASGKVQIESLPDYVVVDYGDG